MLQLPVTRKKRIRPRDAEIYELVCRRKKSFAAIGKMFGISRQRVHMIANEMDKLTYAEMAQTVMGIKARQTATLRHIAQESMAAWAKSKRAQVTVHTRRLTDGTTYREKTVSRGCGNAAYLDTAKKAMEDIRKIWGAESPKQVQVDAQIDVVPAGDRLQAIAERMAELIPKHLLEEAEDDDGQRQTNVPTIVESGAQQVVGN